MWGLTARSNDRLLEEQYRKFRPAYLCLADSVAADRLRKRLVGEPVQVLDGEKNLLELAALSDIEVVLNAVVGAAGLQISLAAVRSGKRLALANKESLVAGGPLFAELCRQSKARILPIDSEHSAVWQALACGRQNEIRTIILTASGGPFRTWPLEKFPEITVEQALAHPTWNMGSKITIDSATLVNKGMEVIEAVVLFDTPAEKIKVVVHPQSIIHSMVEFCDSSVIAQLSRPDMRLPIAYALFWPERVDSDFGRIDWSDMPGLTFEPPDERRFPVLKLAYQVAATGGTAPAVYNAASEIAVKAFLDGALGFTHIADIIQQTVQEAEIVARPQLTDILQADRDAREKARKIMEKTTC